MTLTISSPTYAQWARARGRRLESEGPDDHRSQRELAHVEHTKDQAADAKSDLQRQAGGAEFSGVSINEIATTMPSQTNAAAAATAQAACAASSLCQQPGEDSDVAAVEVPGGSDERDRAAAQQFL